MNFLLAFLFSGSLSFAVAPTTDQARSNFVKIDALDVANRWQAGVHVNWRTGLPDGHPEKSAGKHTHCSAFAASAADLLGIYLLRPPEHSQIFLASAQADWLISTAGRKEGWSSLASAIDAQNAANSGDLVLAVYKNPVANHPGHIVIIRPSQKADAVLQQEGPEITQAGLKNYTSTNLVWGFRGHPHAIENHEVRFFRHMVKPN